MAFIGKLYFTWVGINIFGFWIFTLKTYSNIIKKAKVLVFLSPRHGVWAKQKWDDIGALSDTIRIESWLKCRTDRSIFVSCIWGNVSRVLGIFQIDFSFHGYSSTFLSYIQSLCFWYCRKHSTTGARCTFPLKTEWQSISPKS